jgi:hypothetical protein
MVLEILQGGELFTHLQNAPDGIIDDAAARFYGG